MKKINMRITVISFGLFALITVQYHACQVDSLICLTTTVPWAILDHVVAPIIPFVLFWYWLGRDTDRASLEKHAQTLRNGTGDCKLRAE